MSKMKNKWFILVMFLCLLGAMLTAYGKEKPTLGSRGNGILCTDRFPGKAQQQEQEAAGREIQAEELSYPPYPYDETFELHSYPISNYKLYIDVDGHTAFGETYTTWDPAGDGDSFSEAERLLIQKMWYLVSEDYMPFTIDVTTEDPGDGFLGMRAVVDGGELWDYGWAYMNTWPNTNNNVAYTGTWGDDWIYIAQAASHEVGHTLGVKDHGDDTTGYYMGHGEGATAWGVIMGWDSYGLGVWDDGDYPNANNPEDSIAIIDSKVGADFRPDDHGSDIGTATPITLPATLELVAEGVIEQRTDLDYFAFYTSGGNVQFSINEDVIIGIAQTNLDVLAKIHDASGAVLYESNPLWEIWASFDVTLGAGNYYLSIDGTGQDHPDGDPIDGFGYSDYGILGYYSIYATGPTVADPDVTPPTPDPMTFATAPYATSDTSIAMEATVATDTENGVEYNFICTAGGGNDSGWQASVSYTDTGLTMETEYTYTVTARDTSGNYNETAPSSAESATTLGDTFPPTPDPMTWDSVPTPGGGGSVGISYVPISGDADSGISSDNTYTHAIDFGNQPADGGVATVNGVIFANGGAGDFPAIGGSSQTVGTGSSTIPTSHNGDTAADAVLTAGGMRNLVHDMTYNDATAVIQLTGLTPGQPYQFRLYHRSWGGTRPQDIGFDTDGIGTDIAGAEDTGVFFQDDATQPDPSFATATQVYAFTYDYTLSPGVTTLTVYSNQTGTGTYHLYGLTNQEVAGGDPDTTIVMTATTATDASGVEYYFDCVSGPGNDSGWQDDTTYVDTGLQSGTEYGYTVTARDKSTAQNETTASVIAYATTTGTAPGDPVPDVVGMTQAAAEAAIVADGFVVGTVDTDYSPTVPVGDVISQDPTAGTSLPAGSSVDLVVSLGVQMVNVPNVVGQAQATAEANITAALLTVGNVTTIYSDTVSAGDVISQNPAGGASVAAGSSVDLVVSLGIQMVTVPDVVDMSQASAEAAITAAILTVGNVTTAYSPIVPAGDVISQNPTAGASVPHDSAVDIVVSLGILMVDVPDVVGLAQATAEADIIAVSLIAAASTDYSPTVPVGDVISQNPAGGTSVAAGSIVYIVVSLGVEPVTVPNVVGMTQAAAEAAITAATLTVGNVTTIHSDTVPAGEVISQDPTDGASVPAGTSVDLVVSGGDMTAPNPDPMTWDVVPAPVSTGGDILVYEPFDYAAAEPINGLAVNAVGLTGSWSVVAGGTPIIGTSSVAYSTLPVTGKCWKPGAVWTSPQIEAALDAAVMAGHLDDGDELWFSFTGNVGLTWGGTPDGGNGHRVQIGADSSNHVGIYAEKVALNTGRIRASIKVGGVETLSADSVTFTDDVRLFVGRVIFGTTDTVEVYLPGSDLALPASPAGTITGSLDQSAFDMLRCVIENGNTISQDEIRIGTTYESVIGAAAGGDSETEITMTASTATDVSGVEYLFECVSGPGNDSGWQDDTTYVDTDLQPGTEYTYMVTARDKSAAQNATAPSTAESATTEGEAPGDPVPDVVGMTQAAAEAAIIADGFVVGTVDTEYSDIVALDDVISQDPVAGTSLPAGSSIDLVVSLGVQMVTVPDVVGMAQAAAESAITAAVLTVGNVTTAYSPTVPTGDVISQNPTGGASVVHDSAVDIVVSLGVEPVTVPDVVGTAQAAAEAAIIAADLVVGNVITDYSDTVAAGDVISQNPTGGASVDPGTSVDLVVSLGVLMVTVPDVVGMAQATAESTIVAAILTVGNVTTAYSPTVPAGDVISQNPTGGASVVHDSAVDIVVSLGVQPVTVPNVVGMAQAAAEAAITAATLNVGNVTTAYSPTVPAGDVISQDPTGGSSVMPGTSVDLVVSLGIQMVTVPNVVGMTQTTAESAITGALLIVGNITTAYSDTVAAGDVISQNPTGGASAAAGSTVDIVVSLGVQMVTVPDVTGMAQAAAEAALTAAQLTTGNVTTAYSDTVAAGDVISQNPTGGASVPHDSAVDLVVSLGVQMVTVPDVVGMDQATAEAAIVAAILTVGNVTTATSETVPEGDVISQNPTGGASVAADSAVDIVVSLGDEPPLEWENVVLPANGGVLEYFTSEYGGEWIAADLTNGVTTENGWCSAINPASPQEFVYSFDSGNNAILSEAVIHGGLAEGLYFSKDVQVWTSANGTDYTLAASGTLLNQSYTSITLDLGDVEAKKVKLMITSGYRPDYWELSEFVVTGSIVPPPPDTTAPTPNPMTWATAPTATGDDTITMTATTATDDLNEVEYYFTCTAGGGNDSDWQSSATYTDTGLTPETEYTYTVTARDTSSNQNTTAASSEASATTEAESVGDILTILKAEYNVGKSELKVEATSSEQPNVVLTVVGYGNMTWLADKVKYEYKKKPVANPGATVTVTSSGGGQATKNVTLK